MATNAVLNLDLMVNTVKNDDENCPPVTPKRRFKRLLREPD